MRSSNDVLQRVPNRAARVFTAHPPADHFVWQCERAQRTALVTAKSRSAHAFRRRILENITRGEALAARFARRMEGGAMTYLDVSRITGWHAHVYFDAASRDTSGISAR